MQLTTSVLDYITLGIAVWGALLSTFLAINGMRKEIRRIKVYCYVIEYLGTSTEKFNGEVVIKVVNVGH